MHNNHIISHTSQNLSKWLKIFSRYSLWVTIRRDLFISCELLWLNCSIYQTGMFKFSGSVVLSTHISDLKSTSLVWALSHMWNLLLCALCEKMWLIHIKKSTFDLWEQKCEKMWFYPQSISFSNETTFHIDLADSPKRLQMLEKYFIPLIITGDFFILCELMWLNSSRFTKRI